MVAGPASFGGDDALDRAESGTAPGSPLGEAFSWLHSAEKKHGGVTNPLFGGLSRSGTTSHASPQVHPKRAQSPAPSAPGEESENRRVATSQGTRRVGGSFSLSATQPRERESECEV